MTGRSDTTSRDFFDTNILVYASDDSEPDKQPLAIELVEEAVENGSGVLSAQVLGEFFNSVTRRIRRPLSMDEAELLIEKYSAMTVVALDLDLVKRAVATSGRYQGFLLGRADNRGGGAGRMRADHLGGPESGAVVSWGWLW